MAKLLYFTNSFPYGIGEEWKHTELLAFTKYFDTIVVAPLAYNGNHVARKLPDSIRVLSPLFENDGLKTNFRQTLKTFFQNPYFIPQFVFELTKIKSFGNIKSLLVDYQKISRILSSSYYKAHVAPEMNNAVLYYFWGKGYADILPFLSKQQKKLSVVRFHGYDLYEERNDGYVPNQKSIISAANLVLSISQHGLKYLVSRYPNFDKKILCSLLGTAGGGLARASSDGTLRIVSCAFVAPVKRLHLIPEALGLLKQKVTWTHIGGGEGLQDLIDMAKTLPANIKTNFVGSLEPSSITKLYASNEFDLFLNVSSSEGLPVSIMEALSAGIPVIATDVGGTSEIIDENVGFLLPKELEPSELASAINQYMQLSVSKKQKYRRACYQCYLEKLQAATLASELAQKIIHNTKPSS